MSKLTFWYYETFLPKMKCIHKSFTNWFNAGGGAMMTTIIAYPEVVSFLDERDLMWIILIGNVIIRMFKTTKAIEAK